MQYDRLPEKRLVAAVVALAVRDACLPPIGKKDLILTSEAASAFDFLFTDLCEGYMTLIDMNPQHFRSKLIRAMYDASHRDKPIKAIARRAFRINHKLWSTEYARLGGRVYRDKGEIGDDALLDFEEEV